MAETGNTAGSATIVNQGDNFRPLPCIGSSSGFSGLITVTQANGKNSGKNHRTLSATLQAAVLVTYQPHDDQGMPDLGAPAPVDARQLRELGLRAL